MVDFNNETTIGTPAANVVRILILQRRADLFEAIESYNKSIEIGIQVSLGIIKSRLFSLWLELQAALKRKLTEPGYNLLLEKVHSDNYLELIEVVYEFNEYLDAIRLTRIDTKEAYNPLSVEEENKSKNL